MRMLVVGCTDARSPVHAEYFDRLVVAGSGGCPYALLELPSVIGRLFCSPSTGNLVSSIAGARRHEGTADGPAPWPPRVRCSVRVIVVINRTTLVTAITHWVTSDTICHI
jgi:hypothetical protein